MAPPATTAYVPVSYTQTQMAPRAPGVVSGNREPRYTRTEMAPPPAGRVSAPSIFNAAAQRVLGRPSWAPRLDVPQIERPRSLGQAAAPASASYSNDLAPMFAQAPRQAPTTVARTIGSLPGSVRLLMGLTPIVGGLVAGAYVGNKTKHPVFGAVVGGAAGLGLVAGYTVMSLARG